MRPFPPNLFDQALFCAEFIYGDMTMVQGLKASIQDMDAPFKFDLKTALYRAVSNNQGVLVDILLAAGANPNATSLLGAAPLVEAVKRGYVDLAKKLLDAGASVNSSNDFNNTPLLLAVAYEQPEIVQLLLEHGADPAMEDPFGTTPINLAEKKNYTNMLELFKNHLPTELSI